MSRFRPARVTALVTGCVWLAGGPAQAFFPPLPIGTGPVTIVPQPTLPNSSDGNITPVPPVPPPPFVPPPPPPVVPQDTPNPPHHPQTVPEPASMVSALAGLTALAAAARKRRKSSDPTV